MRGGRNTPDRAYSYLSSSTTYALSGVFLSPLISSIRHVWRIPASPHQQHRPCLAYSCLPSSTAYVLSGVFLPPLINSIRPVWRIPASHFSLPFQPHISASHFSLQYAPM